MSNNCNEQIRKAMALSKALMVLADEGDACMEDDGCGVLFGVLRDCAYKIRGEAERERERHREQGVWDEQDQMR
jgi:hypothetical protein